MELDVQFVCFGGLVSRMEVIDLEFNVVIHYSTRRKNCEHTLMYSRSNDFIDLFDGSCFFAARNIIGQALVDFLTFNGSRHVVILWVSCYWHLKGKSDVVNTHFVT